MKHKFDGLNVSDSSFNLLITVKALRLFTIVFTIYLHFKL